MKRRAVFFRLKDGFLEKYKTRHDQFPDKMKALLRSAGKKNFSIWTHDNMMFMYFESDDLERMDQILENSEDRRAWREEMAKYIEVDVLTGQSEAPMDLVFLYPGENGE